MNQNKYLFDSDVLIVAKNIHYSPNFCLAFWDWIVTGNNHSVFYTIDKVFDEIKHREDSLRDFIELHNEYFVKNTTQKEVITKYSEIQTWAHSTWLDGKDKNKTRKALEVFANEKTADPWLVAYASINGCSIISNEIPAFQSLSSIKLPDVANAFGVNVVKLNEVLNIYSGHNFSFKVS